jgi:hypothetical protein
LTDVLPFRRGILPGAEQRGRLRGADRALPRRRQRGRVGVMVSEVRAGSNQGRGRSTPSRRR